MKPQLQKKASSLSGSGQRQQLNSECPALNLKSLILPEFNLKESDTVKRRHKPKHSLKTEEVLSPKIENKQPQISCLHMHTSSTLSESLNQQRLFSKKLAPWKKFQNLQFPHNLSLLMNNLLKANN